MKDAFISYSRQDKVFVGRLVGEFGAHAKDIWVDWEDIPPAGVRLFCV